MRPSTRFTPLGDKRPWFPSAPTKSQESRSALSFPAIVVRCNQWRPGQIMVEIAGRVSWDVNRAQTGAFTRKVSFRKLDMAKVKLIPQFQFPARCSPCGVKASRLWIRFHLPTTQARVAGNEGWADSGDVKGFPAKRSLTGA